MARSHGKNIRLLVNSAHVSGDITGWGGTHQRAYGDITTPLDDGDRWLPGRVSGEMRIKGLFDDDAGSLWAVADAVSGTDDGLLVTAMPEGLAAGGVALITLTDVESVTADAGIDDAVPIEIQAKPDYGVDMGVILHALAAETADADGDSVDGAASTARGGAASLHVTAYSGLTSAVVKVQHSADDSAWSDLATFATATDVTHELVTVTGTVNQYVRASVDVTGTGSITFAVAFARR